MKKHLFLLSVIACVFAWSSVCAAQGSPLGPGNIALKVSYISFTEDEDTGVYAGLEGYGEIRPNLYLGGEVGYANSMSETDTFVPIEVNLKYALNIASDLVLDIGAGGSYNYVEEEHRDNDWVLGLQFFTDLNYTLSRFFIGIHAKYQQTEHYKDSSKDFNNLRLGGQIGMKF